MSVAPVEPLAGASALHANLVQLLGREHAKADAAAIDFYSSDVFDKGVPAEAVISPGTVEEACAAIRLCTEAGRTVIPRGGGVSYTSGYLPVRAGSIMVDLSRLTRIVEINEEDMFVTVEAGVTWSQLYDALSPRGLRTPYWGTVSGTLATVGGGLSQGATHFGSGEFGMGGDSCLGLEVIIADGTLVRTGSGSNVNRPTPFFRGYGPDLTGLFLNDTGALGFKARLTLKLIKAPQHQRYTSIAFERLEDQLAAMAEVARNRLCSECGGWDPALVRRFGSASTDIQDDLKYLASVVKTGGSLLGGLKDAAKIALAGRRDWQAEVYLMHVTIDEFSGPAADEKLKAVEAIAERFGGRAIPPSYPRAHRARPFTALADESRVPERTLPTHAVCPHSRALEVARKVYAVFEETADLRAKHNITWALISSTVGPSATLIEPLIYYPDARGAHYSRTPKPGETPPSFGEADAGTIEALRVLRQKLKASFLPCGVAHLQIGKSYPYREGRDPATWALLEGIKAVVDPKGLINPGSLGLNRPA